MLSSFLTCLFDITHAQLTLTSQLWIHSYISTAKDTQCTLTKAAIVHLQCHIGAGTFLLNL